MAKQHDKQFKLDAVQYYQDHKDLGVRGCAENLGIGYSTLTKWLKDFRESGDIPVRGSGNYASDEQKEIARLKRELSYRLCNGCSKKINHCTIAHKYRYDARFADRKYRELLSDSRAGINMTKRQLHQKDQIITPLIEQGRSPYQILTNHPELEMSVRSMYTYIDKGLFTARNIDLKRQPKF